MSVNPVFRYRLEEEDYFGQISGVYIQIHKEFGEKYSNKAEYVVIARDTNDPEKRMMPETDYPLGSPPESIVIHDRNNKKIESVQFEAGTKYLMVVTVAGDASESIRVIFETQ